MKFFNKLRRHKPTALKQSIINETTFFYIDLLHDHKLALNDGNRVKLLFNSFIQALQNEILSQHPDYRRCNLINQCTIGNNQTAVIHTLNYYHTHAPLFHPGNHSHIIICGDDDLSIERMLRFAMSQENYQAITLIIPIELNIDVQLENLKQEFINNGKTIFIIKKDPAENFSIEECKYLLENLIHPKTFYHTKSAMKI